MTRILWLSDASCSMTGFGTQSKMLLKKLHETGYDVVHCGQNYIGQPLKNFTLEDGEVVPYLMVPGSPRTPYGQDVLPEYFDRFKPDIFGVLLDSFMLHPWVWHPAHNFQIPCKSVGWWPSDGGWFPEGCENVLKRFNYNVMMAKFGQEQVQRLHGLKTWHIPHGVDTQNYKRLSDDERLGLRWKYGKEKLFAFTQGVYWPFRVDLRDKFVVGCVARNQPRKMMDRLIKSFCLFAKGKEDVVLLMHSDARDVAAGFNLQNLADRHGEGRKVYWTGIRYTDCYPTSQMNELFNLFDCHFLLTSGEGFGVPIIEAMSCEVPNVVTDYTTTKELVTDHDAGLGVNLVGADERPYPAEQLLDGTMGGTFMVDRGMASIKHGAQCLTQLYEDWKNGGKEARRMGANGRKAVLEKYDFDECVWKKGWKPFFEDIQ